ncbi:MAG TPA: DUF3016 domain-containing protein [Burkholderiales bacterium]|nr:DUF3016 domain-containing protein [Burkholderiales bacterium]
MIIVRNMGIAGFVATVLAASPAVAATVQVAFKDADKFTDFGDTARVVPDARRNAMLGELRAHVQKRAAGRIPEKTQLIVTVTDIDMAGGFETARGPKADHVRIYRDGYPPRIKLEFTLTDFTGKVVKEGKRELTDAAYLKTSVEYRNDPLRYEKKLIDDWVAREFSERPGGDRR